MIRELIITDKDVRGKYRNHEYSQHSVSLLSFYRNRDTLNAPELLSGMNKLLQMVTYLVCDGLRYRFKELISRVRQVTKDIVRSEV